MNPNTPYNVRRFRPNFNLEQQEVQNRYPERQYAGVPVVTPQQRVIANRNARHRAIMGVDTPNQANFIQAMHRQQALGLNHHNVQIITPPLAVGDMVNDGGNVVYNRLEDGIPREIVVVTVSSAQDHFLPLIWRALEVSMDHLFTQPNTHNIENLHVRMAFSMLDENQTMRTYMKDSNAVQASNPEMLNPFGIGLDFNENIYDPRPLGDPNAEYYNQMTAHHSTYSPYYIAKALFRTYRHWVEVGLGFVANEDGSGVLLDFADKHVQFEFEFFGNNPDDEPDEWVGEDDHRPLPPRDGQSTPPRYQNNNLDFDVQGGDLATEGLCLSLDEIQLAVNRQRGGCNCDLTKGPNTGASCGSILHRVGDHLFVRGGLDNYFYATKAVIKTPEFSRGFCFPMAIIRAQCRVLQCEPLDKDGDIRKANNSTDCSDLIEIFEPKHSASAEAFLNDLKEPINDHWHKFTVPGILKRLPHVKYEPWRHGDDLVLFNPQKKSLPRNGRGLVRYEIDEEDEQECWVDSARLLHDYVEQVCKIRVRPNSLSECLAAYSFVFGVHISVYNTEAGGNRACFSVPTLKEGVNNRHEFRYCINLMKDGNHVHAITNIRCFKRANMRVETGLYTFCDLCTEIKRSNNMTIEDGKKHFKQCCLNKDYTKNLTSMEQYLRRKNTSIEPKFQVFPAKDSTPAPYCKICSSFDCDNEHHDKKPRRKSKCPRCGGFICRYDINGHKCYIPKPSDKEPLKEGQLFVYDVEAGQKKVEQSDNASLYAHKLNKICFMKMYFEGEVRPQAKDESDSDYDCNVRKPLLEDPLDLQGRKEFSDVESFMTLLFNDSQYDGARILAHNGGGYDHQYILQYAEANGLHYENIPSPNNPHKHILLKIFSPTGATYHFLDSMLFMPGSLRGLAISFKLPVLKGDFPHRFNNGERNNYVGPLPPIDHEDDYYCTKTLSTVYDRDQLYKWYETQKKIYICEGEDERTGKKWWDFQKEISYYCWGDVVVLALICRFFRDKALKFSSEPIGGWEAHSVDPFHFMTQSQIALNLFLRGNTHKIAVVHDKIRPSFHPNQIIWLERIQKARPGKIQHAGNSLKEWYDVESESFVCGYSQKSKTIYEYMDCDYYGCRMCGAKKIDERHKHPHRNMTYDVIYEAQQRRLKSMVTNNQKVITMTTCMFNKRYLGVTDYERECANLMVGREMFYGGRTEVFCAWANGLVKDRMIQYHDVCSLYPYVQSSKEMPIGHPETIYGNACKLHRLSRSREDGYWGFIKCRVTPPCNELLGLLPSRIAAPDGTCKLTFDLKEKVGSWHTSELYLAMDNGYVVKEIYEVKHWDSKKRSSDLFRGYTSFFMKQKLEASGWLKLGHNSQDPPEDPKDRQRIAQEVFDLNGGIGMLDPANVCEDDVGYKVAKIFLNCLWGKFGQKSPERNNVVVSGYAEYLKLWNCPHIDRKTLRFRHMANNTFNVSYKYGKYQKPPASPHYNIYISATVTAEARCVLHARMLKVGPERILYCDTDSIIFMWGKDMPDITSRGLGGWENEHKKAKIEYLWPLPLKHIC